MNTVRCADCREPFGIENATLEVLKRSHGTFFCPWGHSNFFPKGPTEADKLRLERDRLKQEGARLEEKAAQERKWRLQEEERRADAERRASAARGQVTKLKNRVSAGVCPCCNRQFVDLHRHMQTKHKGFVAEAVDGDEAPTIQ